MSGLSGALAAAKARAVAAIEAEVPADVVVEAVEGGVRLSGRRLSVRAASDGRLRDFAGLVR
jgi:hypothetical protein